MGISPTGPDTGYGYIQVTGGKAGAQSGKPVKVKTFTEKPDKDLAEVFYNSGEFFWNSGIFAWKASVILKEMTKHLPDVVSVFKGWEDILGGPGEKTFLEKAYSECPKISIDYGDRYRVAVFREFRLVRHRRLGVLVQDGTVQRY